MYSPDANTRFFPQENYGKSSGCERTVILHEATHASFDVFAKSQDDHVLGIDDESAAVLAQALYLRLSEPNAPGAIHGFSMMIDGPGELALKLADIMMADTGNRPYKLKTEQMVKFRAAVANEWGLVKKILPDGTISDRSDSLTIYNGVVCSSCWGQTFRPTGQNAGAALRGGAASFGSKLFPRR